MGLFSVGRRMCKYIYKKIDFLIFIIVFIYLMPVKELGPKDWFQKKNRSDKIDDVKHIKELYYNTDLINFYKQKLINLQTKIKLIFMFDQ